MTTDRIELPIACMRLAGVFTIEDAQRHSQIWEAMENQLVGIDELQDGYAFRFPLDDALFRDIAEYVTYERLCCPFFRFNLELDPVEEVIRLGLTGSFGVKEYLAEEITGRFESP